MSKSDLEEEIRKRMYTEGTYNPSPKYQTCNMCGAKITHNFVIQCVQNHGDDGFEMAFYCSSQCFTEFTDELTA